MSEAEFPGGLGEPVVPVRDAFSAREALLGWMQDIAPYGIFTTDCDFRIRSWNHWLAMHSGMAAETVIGRNVFEVFPDIVDRRLDEHFKRALQGEVSMLSTALHRYLLRLPCVERDANVAQMLQTARVAPLPSGELILGTIAIIEDVTQREVQALQLQRQQEHDRMLSSALGVLMQSSDPVLAVAALFPKITLPLGLEAYFNYLYDEKTDMLRLNAAGGVLPRLKDAIATVRRGEGVFGQCAVSRTPVLRSKLHESEDPEMRVLQNWGFKAYCGFPLLVGDRLVGILAFGSSTRSTLAADEIECLSTVAQYFAIAIDRAQRDQALDEAQRNLREHADQLETKVAERTARLQETIAELESFSYTVAHDLRAPIRALKGYAEILLSDYQLPSGSAELVQRLQRASDRLDALTRDLLTFTQIARQPVTLAPVDVEEVVDDLVVLMPALEGDVLTIDGPLPKVWAHRSLLQQCFSNLFDNALKFAPAGRPPRIIVRSEEAGDPATAQRGATTAFQPALRHKSPAPLTPSESAPTPVPEEVAARVRICVEDNGPGIPREVHEKIFGIFERMGSGEGDAGTGIGLAIVARAMAKMRGSCGVRSSPGEGSCFWLEFARAEGK